MGATRLDLSGNSFGSARLSRRSAVRMLAGAATVAAGSAILASCGASPAASGTQAGGAAAGSASTAAAAPGALAVSAGTGGASKDWFNVVGNQIAVVFRGDDMWGTADTFTYLNQKAAGAGTWSVFVSAQDNTNSWAKAGIMARSSLDPTSADVIACVTPGNGTNLQYRETTGDNEGTTNTDYQVYDAGATAPLWVKLSTDGNGNWTAWDSPDGKTWGNMTTGAQDPVVLGSTYLIGLAACAHDNTQHGVATFSGLSGFKTNTFSCDLVGTNDTMTAPTTPPVPGA